MVMSPSPPNAAVPALRVSFASSQGVSMRTRSRPGGGAAAGLSTATAAGRTFDARCCGLAEAALRRAAPLPPCWDAALALTAEGIAEAIAAMVACVPVELVRYVGTHNARRGRWMDIKCESEVFCVVGDSGARCERDFVVGGGVAAAM